jgi:hypothetical protein
VVGLKFSNSGEVTKNGGFMWILKDPNGIFMGLHQRKFEMNSQKWKFKRLVSIFRWKIFRKRIGTIVSTCVIISWQKSFKLLK